MAIVVVTKKFKREKAGRNGLFQELSSGKTLRKLKRALKGVKRDLSSEFQLLYSQDLNFRRKEVKG